MILGIEAVMHTGIVVEKTAAENGKETLASVLEILQPTPLGTGRIRCVNLPYL